jgi:hypothetical protein
MFQSFALGIESFLSRGRDRGVAQFRKNQPKSLQNIPGAPPALPRGFQFFEQILERLRSNRHEESVHTNTSHVKAANIRFEDLEASVRIAKYWPRGSDHSGAIDLLRGIISYQKSYSQRSRRCSNPSRATRMFHVICAADRGHSQRT